VRRNRVWAILAVLAPVLFTGCGTMIGNIGGYGILRGHYMEPYGGVKICLEAGTHSFKEAVHPPANQPRWEGVLAGTYVLGVDLPLSAVADTVTLPWTVHAVLTGEAHTGPVHWGRGCLGALEKQAAPHGTAPSPNEPAQPTDDPGR
jgi:uncharacterized protein YceK